MAYQAAIVAFIGTNRIDLRISESDDPAQGVTIATAPGDTVSDIPQWMKDAYREIGEKEPETFLEAQLIASVCKIKARRSNDTRAGT